MISKFTALILVIALISLFLATCAHLTRDEKKVLVRITSRRIGYYGAKNFPVPFIELGQIAQNACDKPGETLPPSEALEIIIEVITRQLDDPLLAVDLKDLIALLELRLDPSLKLIGVTEEDERLIKVAVCAFAEGVSLHPSPG